VAVAARASGTPRTRRRARPRCRRLRTWPNRCWYASTRPAGAAGIRATSAAVYMARPSSARAGAGRRSDRLVDLGDDVSGWLVSGRLDELIPRGAFRSARRILRVEHLARLLLQPRILGVFPSSGIDHSSPGCGWSRIDGRGVASSSLDCARDELVTGNWTLVPESAGTPRPPRPRSPRAHRTRAADWRGPR
jgi:hypothetical protein